MKTKNKLYLVLTSVLLFLASKSIFAALSLESALWRHTPDIPKIPFGEFSILPIVCIFAFLLFINAVSLYIFKIKDKTDIKNVLIYNIAYHLPASLLITLPYLLIKSGVYDNGGLIREIVIVVITLGLIIAKNVLDYRLINKILCKQQVKPLNYMLVNNVLPYVLTLFLTLYIFGFDTIIPFEFIFDAYTLFIMCYLLIFMSIILYLIIKLKDDKKMLILIPLIIVALIISNFEFIYLCLALALLFFFASIIKGESNVGLIFPSAVATGSFLIGNHLLNSRYYYGYDPIAVPVFLATFIVLTLLQSIVRKIRNNSIYKKELLTAIIINIISIVSLYVFLMIGVCYMGFLGGHWTW